MTLPNIPMRDPQSWKGHLWVLTPALIKKVMAVMVSGQNSTTLSYRKRPCLRKQKQNRSSDMVFSLSAGSSPCKNQHTTAIQDGISDLERRSFRHHCPFEVH